VTEAGSSALKTAYEGGNLSLRALAREFGISESLVRKKAAAGGWVRTPRPAETGTVAGGAQGYAGGAQGPRTPAHPPAANADKGGPDPLATPAATLLVSAPQLAELCQVTRPAIQAWLGEGLPYRQADKGAPIQIALLEAIPWLRLHKWNQGGQDRGRKLKAEADLAEMEAAEKARSLVDAALAQRVWEDFLSRLKATLRSFPDRIVPLLEEGGTLAERLTIIRREVDQVLRDIVAQEARP
jgi:phage terminase Nu1 subunit (DNA packaging protein)